MLVGFILFQTSCTPSLHYCIASSDRDLGIHNFAPASVTTQLRFHFIIVLIKTHMFFASRCLKPGLVVLCGGFYPRSNFPYVRLHCTIVLLGYTPPHRVYSMSLIQNTVVLGITLLNLALDVLLRLWWISS